MKYWQQVIHEVVNQHSSHTKFWYTTIKDREKQEYEPKKTKQSSRIQACYTPNGTTINFNLRDIAPIYLTRREAQVMKLLIQGMSIRSASQFLKLSHRTVEYYLRRIREKAPSMDRDCLLDLFRDSSLLP